MADGVQMAPQQNVPAQMSMQSPQMVCSCIVLFLSKILSTFAYPCLLSMFGVLTQQVPQNANQQPDCLSILCPCLPAPISEEERLAEQVD